MCGVSQDPTQQISECLPSPAAAREPKRPEWFPTFKRWGRKTIRAVVNTVERFRSAWVAFWTGADREVMDAQRQAKVKA